MAGEESGPGAEDPAAGPLSFLVDFLFTWSCLPLASVQPSLSCPLTSGYSSVPDLFLVSLCTNRSSVTFVIRPLTLSVHPPTNNLIYSPTNLLRISIHPWILSSARPSTHPLPHSSVHPFTSPFAAALCLDLLSSAPEFPGLYWLITVPSPLSTVFPPGGLSHGCPAE